jgi:hypothetical protein
VPADDDPSSWRPPNEQAMFRTVNALLMHQLKLKMHDGDADATNTNDDDDDDGFVDHDHPSVLLRGIRRTPDSLDFSRKRKFVSVKFQLPEKEENGLNEIIEECEYDSDIGKFKCKDEDALEPDESENSSTSSMVDHYLQVEHMNDLNSPLKCVNKSGLDMNNIDNIDGENGDGDAHYKIVMKRIEFFENGVKQENSSVDAVDGVTETTGENQLLSTILLAIFILTVALLIVFPLPN